MRKNIQKCNYYHYFKLLINDQNTCKQITLHVFIQWSNRRVDWPDQTMTIACSIQRSSKITIAFQRKIYSKRWFDDLQYWDVRSCVIVCTGASHQTLVPIIIIRSQKTPRIRGYCGNCKQFFFKFSFSSAPVNKRQVCSLSSRLCSPTTTIDRIPLQ